MENAGRLVLMFDPLAFESFQRVGLELRKSFYMKTKQFDRDFDAGKDVTGALDLSKARRAKLDLKRVNVDFPIWMVEALDHESSRLGVTRQSLIKMWLAERLEQLTTNRANRNKP
jgi:hypothetical protein